MAGNENEMTEQVMQILRNQYDKALRKDSDQINPAWLAAGAYEKMDPSTRAPILVRYTSSLQLRQMARGLCRKEHETQEAESEQHEMFELQAYYPAQRNGEEVYVKRAELTLAERQANITRLRAEAESKSKHADALQAETDALMAKGYFAEQAA